MKSSAVGVMHIKPATAREKESGINAVATCAEDNIHAERNICAFPSTVTSTIPVSMSATRTSPFASKQ